MLGFPLHILHLLRPILPPILQQVIDIPKQHYRRGKSVVFCTNFAGCGPPPHVSIQNRSVCTCTFEQDASELGTRVRGPPRAPELFAITTMTGFLQKLHQRFSSRTAQTSQSSKKISLVKNPSKHSATPLDEARKLFPGYQEFFFLFLQDT